MDENNYKIINKFRSIYTLLPKWNIVLVLLSAMAFFIPWIWGIILLDVIKRNKEMGDIVKSITHNLV